MKPVWYTAHARRRLRQRRITRRQVRQVLATGVRRELGGGDFEARGAADGRRIVVIYNETAQRILVITLWEE